MGRYCFDDRIADFFKKVMTKINLMKKKSTGEDKMECKTREIIQEFKKKMTENLLCEESVTSERTSVVSSVEKTVLRLIENVTNMVKNNKHTK